MMQTKTIWLGLIFCCYLNAMQRPAESSLRSIELKPSVKLTDITAYLKDNPEQKKYSLIIQSDDGKSTEISKPYPQISAEPSSSIQNLSIKGVAYRHETLLGIIIGIINKLPVSLIVTQCSIHQPDRLSSFEFSPQDPTLGITTAEDEKQNLVITLLSDRDNKFVCSRFHLGFDNMKMVVTPYTVSEFTKLVTP